MLTTTSNTHPAITFDPTLYVSWCACHVVSLDRKGHGNQHVRVRRGQCSNCGKWFEERTYWERRQTTVVAADRPTGE